MRAELTANIEVASSVNARLDFHRDSLKESGDQINFEWSVSPRQINDFTSFGEPLTSFYQILWAKEEIKITCLNLHSPVLGYHVAGYVLDKRAANKVQRVIPEIDCLFEGDHNHGVEPSTDLKTIILSCQRERGSVHHHTSSRIHSFRPASSHNHQAEPS